MRISVWPKAFASASVDTPTVKISGVLRRRSPGSWSSDAWMACSTGSTACRCARSRRVAEAVISSASPIVRTPSSQFHLADSGELNASQASARIVTHATSKRKG